jgi:hypothetical protein
LYGGLQVDEGYGWQDTDDIEEWVDIRGDMNDPVFVPSGLPVKIEESPWGKLKEIWRKLKEIVYD